MSIMDETWTAKDYREERGIGAVVIEGADATRTVVYMGLERATLAAAAPDMARVLLALEHDRDGECIVCSVRTSSSHADDCPWLLAMQKAGLR